MTGAKGGEQMRDMLVVTCAFHHLHHMVKGDAVIAVGSDGIIV
jgi:hypothetical protein